LHDALPIWLKLIFDAHTRGFYRSAVSVLKRVRHLEEQLAAGALQAVSSLLQGPFVAVAEEEHGLPVQLVGEEGRAGEGVVARRHGEGVEAGVAVHLVPFADEAEEGTRGEGPGRLEAGHLGGEQTSARRTVFRIHVDGRGCRRSAA